MGPMIEKFVLGENVEHHRKGKFRGESNGDRIDALKRCLDPEMAHNDLMWGQSSKNLKFE